jgi:hypothetical protein
MLATTFEGYGLGNVNFGSAPDGRWEFPVAAERPYSYARTDWAPSGLKGFYTWSYTEGATENPTYTAVTDLDRTPLLNVTNKVLTANVATLTTEIAHGYAVGHSVVVAGVDTDLNGTFTLTGVTGTTLSYAKVANNIATSAVTSANAVVYSTPSLSTTEYNVPGNINYNADIGTDRVIRSNEDPTA